MNFKLLKQFLATALTLGCLGMGAAQGEPGTSSPLKIEFPGKKEDRVTTAALMAGKVDGVIYRRNVSYLGPKRAEKLDVCLPAKRNAEKRSPVIVMIHGGGWIGGLKDASREVQAGVAFARAGYVTVSVEYFKKRGESWPRNLLDCKNAVRWVRKNADDLQVDVNRIGVMGGSAGGHLALMTAYTTDVPELEPEDLYPGVSDRVGAVVDLYGITNLLTRQQTSKSGEPNGQPKSAGGLFTDSREAAPEKWKLASPVTHVTSSTPPTLIIQGSQDTTVDRDQSYELARRLKQAGVKHELHIIPGAGHAFMLNDLRRHKEDLRPRVIRFFNENL